jgi:PhnB protein
MNVKAIPSGYSSVTPYLIVEGATEAIEFYKQVFGATERMRLPLPGGKIAHAEIQIGDSVVMLADQPTGPTAGRSKSPTALDGTAVSIHLYIEDVDSVMEKATKAGAQQVRAVANQFYGIVPASSPTLLAMSGMWPRILKIYRQKKWRNGWRNFRNLKARTGVIARESDDTVRS